MAKQSVNKTLYWVIGGVIVLVLAGLAGYKVLHHRSASMMQYGTTPTSGTNANQQSTMQTTTGKGGLQNKTDTSNGQLDQDTQDVQNSLNQLQQDQGSSDNDTTSQSQDIPQQ